ncbi:MAG: hypothetical protein AAF456_16030 [Planctomycetota bacterium]
MNQQDDQLARPGAGLPSFERSVLSLALRSGAFVWSEKKFLRMFHAETQTLLNIIWANPIATLGDEVLIDRLTGMEDSSRYWSVLMVLEHLAAVNSDIADIITSLNDDVAPEISRRGIAEYKPDPEVGSAAIDRFEHVSKTFESRIACLGKLVSRARFPHPWFGPINSKQWLALACFHQRLHRRQAQKIVAVLGAV